MGYFPFFVELKGKRGLIVGGGIVAERKVRKLLPYEPELLVVAPKIDDGIWKLSEEIKEKRKKNEDASELILSERDFETTNLEKMDFVIAATSDEALNTRIAKLCEEKHILVNVVDDKEKCGFLFPSLIREGKLTIGISTEGASPRVATTFRTRLSADIPERMEEILDYLEKIRPFAKMAIEDEKKRAAFLMELADMCMEKGRPLTEDECEILLENYQIKTPEDVFVDKEAPLDREVQFGKETPSDEKMQSGKEAYLVRKISPGKVVLVGAGCLSYEYITLRGMQEIRKAQVLIYDALIDTRLLDFTIENCEKICVGKRSGRHSMKQEDINMLLIEKAKEGAHVVRLKGGDPFVFGRGNEEVDALTEAGIETEVIPGISSCIAVPELAGIPVTERKVSRSFHVMTGHFAGDEESLKDEIHKMAAMDGTCVFLMGYTRLAEIVRELQNGGAAAETPVAVIHGTSDGSSRAAYGTLFTIEKEVQEKQIPMPAVIVVGDTVRLPK